MVFSTSTAGYQFICGFILLLEKTHFVVAHMDFICFAFHFKAISKFSALNVEHNRHIFISFVFFLSFLVL